MDGGQVQYDDQRLVVLLLEDDDADAYLTKRALSGVRRVSQVIRAKSGDEALAMLQDGKAAPNIAFVDLQMPTMDGFEFLAACMDQRLGNIPLVVLTSSSASKDALRSRVQGALRVITKPESPDELRQALSEAIDAFLPARSAPEPRPWERSVAAQPAPAEARSRPTTPVFGRRAPQAS